MSDEMSLEEANAEAVRRIRAAKACGQWWLDLGDLPITRVPDEIVELKDTLRVLALGLWRLIVKGDKPKWRWEGQRPGTLSDFGRLGELTALTTLYVNSCIGVTDLGPLAGLIALTKLDVSNCNRLTDLSPLAGLTALTDLDLSDNIELTDLGPLAGLTALTKLDVGTNRVTDLGPLAGLTALTSLNVSDCEQVTDLTPLAGLTALTSLSVSDCEQVTDLTPLAGLTALTSLNVYKTGVTDLTPLAGLTALTSLNVSDCEQVTDLTPLAGLTALTSLSVSDCEQVTDLTPLAGLTALTSLNVYNTGVTDLTPLAGLTALTSLNVSSCGQVTDLTPLAGLTALTSLSVSDCEQVTDLTPLAGLTALTSLNVSSCGQVTDLTPLAGLTALTSLNVSDCEQVTDLTPLAGLTALTSLSVSDCEQVTDLTPLAGLTALTSLNVSDCEQVTDLTPLAGLTALTSLNVSSCGQVTDLTPLAGLTALTSLNVSDCEQVTDLTPLAGLTALTSLNVSDCEQVTDLTPLAGLTALTSLSVSDCEQVTDLTPLAGLTALTSLNVYNTGVTDLTPLAGLTALTSLNVYNTGVTDLTPLAGLTALTSLDVSNCQQVTDLHPLLDHLPTLKRLCVYGCPFRDLHPSVCGGENSINSVRAYYAALGPDAKPDAEIKVFVLGNGRCGKSYLIQRLTGKSWEQIEAEKIVTTHGVQLGRFTVPKDWGFDHPITLCFWDFGGQDIYHGTHALFLKEPAIYLLLHADATENDHEFTEGGFTMQNRPLGYWFDYLRQEAGRGGTVNSPVLLVKSRCDEMRPAVVVPAADAKAIPNITSAIRVSAKDRWGLNHLIPHLQDALRKLLDEHPQPPLPVSWAAVRDRIREMQPSADLANPDRKVDGGRVLKERPGLPRLHRTSRDQPGRSRKDTHGPGGPGSPAPARTMTLADLKALCDECGCNPGDEVHLRDALALMGVVYYRKGVFGDRIIVDQGWALDAIYTVFKRDHPRFQRKIDEQKGRFTREDLELYFWASHSEDDQRTFLSFMEQCGICFRTSDRHATQYDGFYILPDKLDRWGPEHDLLFRRQLHDHSGTEVTATFTLLHDGIARGFLSKIGSVAGDKATYWRYGCHFHDRATECEVMIRTDDKENAIKLHAWGDKSADVLRTLVKVLEQLPCGNPPTFEWSTPPAEPTRIGRDDPEKDPLEDLKPSRFAAKSVFLSYAWATRHPEADKYDSNVEALCRALERFGFRVYRDKVSMRYGDSIEDFMRNAGTASVVVALVSHKYLRSDFCMSELFQVFLATNPNSDASEYRRRVKPVAMPDGRFHSLDDRDEIADFWAARFGRLNARTSNRCDEDELNLALMNAWGRMVPKMLYHLAVQLHPVGFEDASANDWAKLREMFDSPDAG